MIFRKPITAGPGLPERSHARRKNRSAFQPILERVESRILLTTADGTGPVVTGLAEPVGAASNTLIVSFDGPLDRTLAQNTSEYQVNQLRRTNPELITTSGPSVPITSASYDLVKDQVTLTLARPLAAGLTYRVFINGSIGSGLTGPTGTLFDGDNDDTPGGNFYGLFSQGRTLKFSDAYGNNVTLRATGGGVVEAWRELNGNVDALQMEGVIPNRTVLSGAVRPAPRSANGGQVAIPTINGLTGVTNRLPSPPFVTTAAIPLATPSPVVANARNLPYSLKITPITSPLVPSIQSAVSAQANGLWLLFGGRTNGLHGFDTTGIQNFPPVDQNNNITVINPATGQTWNMPWSATGLPPSEIAALSATNPEFYQKGNQLYTIGGYSLDSTTSVFTTYDTLSSINVPGMINAVINNGNVAAQIRQIQDPRLYNTGGQIGTIGNRTYLVFGQNFQGGYSFPPTGTQIYSDQINSFRIVDNSTTLAITQFQSLRDPVNFRRRDYNLVRSILPNGQPGLIAYGGVFTPSGFAYLNPVLIGAKGAQVNYRYQQYFSQYNSANIPLYDARTKTMDTVFLGGISLYHYDFATGQLKSDTELPFVNDVTTFAIRANGSSQEYIMPSQLPARYGAEASFFVNPLLAKYPNGVIKLNTIKRPTALGLMYGGIYSTVDNTEDPLKQTTASNQIFEVTLIPNRKK